MINLNEKELDEVKKILKKYFRDEKIFVFGSRITNSIKPYSDLDISVKGKTAIDWRILDRVKEEFEESTLNFTVDILDYWRVPESFREIIEANNENLELD